VPTGWGTAVYAGGVRAGDTVVVYGIGGVGINAVQGAAYAGAKFVIVVDPVAFKRETALKLGATHAFATAAEARRLGLKIMAGCMVATSLAMAAALLLAQDAEWVDLDGPLLLERDRVPGLTYTSGTVMPVPAALWG